MILNPLKALPGQALNIGKDIVQAIINGIKAAPGAIIDAVKSVVPGPLRKAVGLLTGATGVIVAAATGTTSGAGRTTLVGENGPEVLSLPSGSRVTPLPPPSLLPSQLLGDGGRQPVIAQVFLDRKMIATALASYSADQQAAR